VVLCLAGVVLLIVGVLSACGGGTPEGLTGMVREPAPDVSEVVLSDGSAGGADYVTRAADGQILLVYFGYTFCPDVCPTTLADVRKVYRELGDGGDLVDFAMVTIDPERDTGDELAEYVHAFLDKGHALRTDDAALLREVADIYGADYDVTKREDGVVEVAHSAFVYAVDPQGRIVVQWAFGTPPEDMVNDLRYLLDQGV
jgi:protein SCO1/2